MTEVTSVAPNTAYCIVWGTSGIVAGQQIQITVSGASGITMTPFQCFIGFNNCAALGQVAPTSTPGANSLTLTYTAPVGAGLGYFDSEIDMSFTSCAAANLTVSVTHDGVTESDSFPCTNPAPAGLSFTKTHTPAAVTQGSSFTWTITLAASAANGHTFSFADALPAGFTPTVVSPTGGPADGCNIVGTTVNCNFPNRTGALNQVISITTTAPSACAAGTNTVTLSIDGTPTTQVPAASDTVTPVGCTPPTPTLTKSNSTGGTADAGETFNWIIQADNFGFAAFGILDDLLPAGFTVAGPIIVSPPTAANCTSGPGVPATQTNINCVFVTPIPAAVTITIPVTAPTGSQACTSYNNQAQAVFQGPISSNVDTIVVANCPPPGPPTITKSNSTGGTADAGETFNWVITTDNFEFAAFGILDDLLPLGFTVAGPITVSPVGAANCTTALDVPTGRTNVSCTYVTPIPQSVTITIPVTAPTGSQACTSYINQAQAVFQGPIGSNVDTVVVANCPPPGQPTITKSNDTGGAVDAGGTFNWIITTDNFEFAAFGILDDLLPLGFTVAGPITVSPVGAANCTTALDVPTGRTNVSCTYVTPIPQSVTITVPVTAPNVCDDFDNVVQAVFQGPIGSNTDTVTVENCPPPGPPTITKSNSTGGTADAGETFNWIITTDNFEFAAFGILDDLLPLGFTVAGPITVSPVGAANCTTALDVPTGRTNVSCTYVTPIPQSVTITVPVTAPNVCDDFDNVVQAVFQGPIGSNTDTVTVENCTVAQPTLTKSHAADDDVVTPGETVDWIIVFGDVQGFILTLDDQLPAGFELQSVSVSPANSGLTCTPNLVDDSVSCLAPGPNGALVDNITVTILATAPDNCDDFTNQAVASINLGPVFDEDSVTVDGCTPGTSDPSIEKVSSTGTNAKQNESFEWRIRLTDAVADNAVYTLSDNVPDGFKILDVSPDANCGFAGQVVTCTFNALAGAVDLTVTITVRASNDDGDCDQFTNVAELRVGGTLRDTDSSNVRIVCDTPFSGSGSGQPLRGRAAEREPTFTPTPVATATARAGQTVAPGGSTTSGGNTNTAAGASAGSQQQLPSRLPSTGSGPENDSDRSVLWVGLAALAGGVVFVTFRWRARQQ